MRLFPNILITGTPGVGKSALCDVLSAITDLTWLEISKIAKENNFILNFDKEYQCSVLDEYKLLAWLEPKLSLGGYIVEYHSCDLFPEKWFDAVYVLSVRSEISVLYDRLYSRGYYGKKLRDNVECEFFHLVYEEAINSFKKEKVKEMFSVVPSQLDDNTDEICKWIRNWYKKQENDSIIIEK